MAQCVVAIKAQVLTFRAQIRHSSYSTGSSVSYIIMDQEPCSHAVQYNGLCAICGQEMYMPYSSRFDLACACIA